MIVITICDCYNRILSGVILWFLKPSIKVIIKLPCLFACDFMIVIMNMGEAIIIGYACMWNSEQYCL